MRGSEERTERRQPADVGTEFEVALVVRMKVIVTDYVVGLDISTGILIVKTWEPPWGPRDVTGNGDTDHHCIIPSL